MADSMTLKSGPAWMSIAKTGATIGRLSGTPDSVKSYTVWAYTWRKAIKADSGSFALTIVSGLRLDSIAPDSGYGGTSITAYGRNFGATQGSSTLAFGDSVPTPSAWANDSISFPCPDFPTADTGYYDFIVDDGTVADTITDAFHYLMTIPVISTLKHPMGRVAYADTCIGSGFGTSGGTATLGGTAVTISKQTDDSLIWVVPNRAKGTVWWKYCVGGLCDSVLFRLLVPSITIINP
jgi:hypothetical protein